MSILLCLAIALHDADTLKCAAGESIRLRGIGATELDGRCAANQPCAPGDPFEQRRALAGALGAEIAADTPNRLWFVRPVPLRCTVDGRSYSRLTAWCQTRGGDDVSCLAVRIGAAVRWARYDRDGRLEGCR